MPCEGAGEGLLRVDQQSSEFHRWIYEKIRSNPSLSVRMRIEKGCAVYNHGDQDSMIYVMESGQVNTTTYSSDGKRCLLQIYMWGDVIGELGLLGHERQETATAMEDSALHQIRASQFLALLENSRVADGFIGYLMSRLVDQQRTITSLVTMNSEHRLAATLLHVSSRLGKKHRGGLKIVAKITHEDLASMVGTTRSRIGLFLKGFRDAGLIELLPGSFLLIDQARLAAFLGGEAPVAESDGRVEPIDVPHQRSHVGQETVLRDAGHAGRPPSGTGWPPTGRRRDTKARLHPGVRPGIGRTGT